MEAKVSCDLPVLPETCPQISTPSSSPSGGASADDLSDTSSTAPPSIINADNYLTLTEGCQSVLTISELKECVNRCKELVIDSKECSDERKWLVRRLIELRHRLEQATEEKPEQEEEAVLHGHHFKLTYEPTSTTKHYCDRCCGTIWHLVQSWYQCLDCHYKCHIPCLAKTIRTCVHLILSEQPNFETRICPEVGLSAQGYRCYECSAHISLALPKGPYSLTNPFSLANSLVEARRCDYTGYYYCPSCHWNSVSVIPARATKNWDFVPRPVCRASYQLLRLGRSKPLITLEQRLYDLVSDLADIKKKREEMDLMKPYIATCRQALDSGFVMKELEWRRHLVHSVDVFSLDDLVDLNSGALLRKIGDIHGTLLRHITAECRVCYGRGYYCEHCGDKKIIFPFDVGVYICPKCSSVQHKLCWVKRQSCSKCKRSEQRKLINSDKELLT